MSIIGVERAKIAAVDDPEKRGRYRVRVLSVHDDTVPVGNLPWAELLCHGGKGWGNIPHYEVDDLVFVLFEGGDREYPVIVGGWLTAPKGVSQLPSEQTGDYSTDRRRWVWKDRVGNLIEVSEKAGEKHVRLKSGGVELKITQEDDSFTVTASGPATIVVGGLATIEAAADVLMKSSGGKVTIDGSADVEVLAGSKIKLGGTPLGDIVTTKHPCAFTGGPHPSGSSKAQAQQ